MGEAVTQQKRKPAAARKPAAPRKGPWTVTGPQLPDLDAVSPTAPRVCFNGTNEVQGSQATWHFIQGHLMEAMALLLAHGLYSPSVALFFEGHHTYTRRNASSFLAFYAPLFDTWPQGVDNCSLVPGATRLTFPRMDFRVDANVRPSYAGLPSARARAEFGRAAQTSLWRACVQTAPMLQRAARRTVPRSAPAGAEAVRFLTFVRRQHGGRKILNPDEVETQLRSFAAAWRLTPRTVFLELLPAAQQIALAAQTRLLIAYHGSGVGALNVWMPRASAVVEVAPPRWPYCIFSACANATRKHYILSSMHGDERAEVWKAGGFSSIKVPWGPQSGRRADVSAALGVAHRLFAGGDVPKNACGQRCTQVWEPDNGTRLPRLPYLHPLLP